MRFSGLMVLVRGDRPEVIPLVKDIRGRESRMTALRVVGDVLQDAVKMCLKTLVEGKVLKA